MNINKICIMLIISIFAFSGIITFGTSSAETWVSEDANATAFRLSHLTATITVTIKNTNDHVQYFKISQAYNPDNKLTNGLNWTIDWDHTSPTPVRMVKSIQSDGDYGWPIKAGETKTVTFKLNANGLFGGTGSYFKNLDSTDQTYWPLVNEPGLIGSWFYPDELGVLNPTFDIKKWTGHFHFRVTNVDNQKVYGIVRAPIAPINSKVTSMSSLSVAKAFIDTETVVSSSIAAWNVVLNPGADTDLQYTYVWPKTSSSSSTAKASSSLINAGGSSGDSTVPSKTTGVPYGLFVVGALVTVAGVAYARFMR